MRGTNRQTGEMISYASAGSLRPGDHWLPMTSAIVRPPPVGPMIPAHGGTPSIASKTVPAVHSSSGHPSSGTSSGGGTQTTAHLTATAKTPPIVTTSHVTATKSVTAPVQVVEAAAAPSVSTAAASTAAIAVATPVATALTTVSGPTSTTAGAEGTVIYIDPTAAAGGNGSSTNPYKNWSFALQPGVTYLQRAGTTFTGVIQVNTVASAAAPTLIGAYGTGSAPVINGSVDFSGASDVEFGGFQMTNGGGASIIIQLGSSNILVANNVVVGSKEGIWIGNNAGSGNSVQDNTVIGSAGAGILIDSTSSGAADETQISNNVVVGSGADGIEVSSNYVMITDNTVAYSGLTTPATSGIHVFTSSATQGTGDHNTIAGNVVGYSQDHTMQDGNGILLDQWTGNNVVSDNFALGNDGAGIALYDSSANFISDNVTGADGVNSGGSHSILAELIVNESLGLTKGNVITGNTFLGFQPNGFAVFVDTEAATAGNSFSGNVFENLMGPDIYQVAGVRGANVQTWNAMLGASDQFGGVAIHTPVAGTSYDYTFAPGTSLYLDGRTVTLTGWSANGGLYGS